MHLSLLLLPTNATKAFNDLPGTPTTTAKVHGVTANTLAENLFSSISNLLTLLSNKYRLPMTLLAGTPTTMAKVTFFNYY